MVSEWYIRNQITVPKQFYPFPNKPWILPVCSICLLKTLWEKEKLLVTINFSFFRSVFYPFEELSAILNNPEIVICKLFPFGRVQNLLFWKGFNCFCCLQKFEDWTEPQNKFFTPAFWKKASV